MKTIGLLLPRSTFYQTISFDIFEGLKSSLNLLGKDDFKIITENIGFGVDKQHLYKSAERLLLDENVDLVIAYIGHKSAQLLRPLFLAANKILIVLDAGANLPHEWSTCPNIIYHSLHNSLGASLTSKLAVNKGFTEGGMVTGYYDGGYLHTYAISQAFSDFGGTICFNHATGQDEANFTMEPLKNHLESYPQSALLTIFSADYIEMFFHNLNKYFPNKNVSVFLTPFGFEESVIESLPYVSHSIYGILSWSKKIDNSENKLFIETVEAKGKNPNLFSLLGWESAKIAAKIFEIEASTGDKISNIIDELRNFEFASPRGNIKFDSKTNHTLSPMYEGTVIDNSGKCEVKIVGSIENIDTAFDYLLNLELSSATSAWHNSYVCI